MPGLSAADSVAHLATLVSIYGALTMAAVLLVLVMRRDRREQARAAEQESMRALTREIMAMLTDGTGSLPLFEQARPQARLAAIGHLAQLVRGRDRERLIALIEERGLLARAVRAVRHGRRRRRVEAIRLLGSIGGPSALGALARALQEEGDPDVRLEAAAMLARVDGLPAPDTLIAALRLGDAAITPLHRALFRTLAARQPADLFAIDVAAMPPPVRALIVDALGWTEDYAALDLLASASADPHPPVRIAAIDAASRLGHPGAALWIMALLDDPEPPVRSRAIRACQAMGLTRSLPAIARLRHDPSPWVRLRAQQAQQALAGA